MAVPWMAIADAAKKGIEALSAGVLAEANINAQNRVNEANAYASNLVRAANNELASKRTSLARFTQSVNNQRVLENTGSAVEATTINYRRRRDASINDSVEQQLQTAEQEGAQHAAAAFSGLTGGVADIVNGTTALRSARLAQRVLVAQEQSDWDAQQRVKQVAQAGWDSLDFSEITDSLDTGRDVAVKQAYSGNILSDLMGNQDPKNLVNLGSFFYQKTSDYFKST